MQRRRRCGSNPGRHRSLMIVSSGHRVRERSWGAILPICERPPEHNSLAAGKWCPEEDSKALLSCCDEKEFFGFSRQRHP